MPDPKFYYISETGELVRLAALDQALSARQDGGFVVAQHEPWR